MSIGNLLKDAAPVLAAFASTASAVAAWRAAAKNSAAAKDSNRALAMVLRPVFAVSPAGRGNSPDPTKETFAVANVSVFTAIDAFVEVRDSNDTVLFSKPYRRVPGQLPNTVGDDDAALKAVVSYRAMAELGDEQSFVVTVRFNDERGLERWEQQFKLRFWIDERYGGDKVTLQKIEGGEVQPVPKKPKRT